MDLNPLFTGASSFRPAGSGGELKLFEQAGIKLFHGWLVDPDSAEYPVLVKAEDYDSAVNLIVEADHVAKGQLVVSEEEPNSSQAGSSSSISGSGPALSGDDKKKVEAGKVLTLFFAPRYQVDIDFVFFHHSHRCSQLH